MVGCISDFPPCHSGQFRCENSLCIPARWRCDGYKVSTMVWTMYGDLEHMYGGLEHIHGGLED